MKTLYIVMGWPANHTDADHPVAAYEDRLAADLLTDTLTEEHKNKTRRKWYFEVEEVVLNPPLKTVVEAWK